jgi:hypothetical protein
MHPARTHLYLVLLMSLQLLLLLSMPSLLLLLSPQVCASSPCMDLTAALTWQLPSSLQL